MAIVGGPLSKSASVDSISSNISSISNVSVDEVPTLHIEDTPTPPPSSFTPSGEGAHYSPPPSSLGITRPRSSSSDGNENHYRDFLRQANQAHKRRSLDMRPVAASPAPPPAAATPVPELVRRDTEQFRKYLLHANVANQAHKRHSVELHTHDPIPTSPTPDFLAHGHNHSHDHPHSHTPDLDAKLKKKTKVCDYYCGVY